MFQSIWDDVKREFQYGNMVTRLIIVNCIVFILVNLVKLILRFPDPLNPIPYDTFLHFFSMPASITHLLTHPWAIITAAFLHQDFGHILWNMLAFFWFGRVVGDLLGNHRILPLYLLGGITGNLVFFFVANVLNIGSFALGASAAVTAMLACAALIAPDYIFNILLVGPVKLKYIALVLLFLDVVAIANNYNAGGSFAHLGGAAMGFFFVYSLRKGIDLGKPINLIITSISDLFNGKNKKTFTYQKGEKEYARTEKKQQTTTQKGNKASDTEGGAISEQERLDIILDKIKQKGYDSLTQDEKEFLFNASKK
jgi:membrane associated rhomboid family serine protease